MSGTLPSDRPASAADATAISREFFARPPPGQIDYWRKMAAPRFRMARISELLAKDPPRRAVDLG